MRSVDSFKTGETHFLTALTAREGIIGVIVYTFNWIGTRFGLPG